MGRALPLNVLQLSVATQKGIRHTVFEWLKMLYTFLIFSFPCLFKAQSGVLLMAPCTKLAVYYGLIKLKEYHVLQS